jgi:uncharacterized heparinase superfamily protein
VTGEVADLGSQLVSRRAERLAPRSGGIPARLRSLLAAPGWHRRPEPRVRYGQLLLPGLALLSRQQLPEARPFLERADAIRGRRFAFLGTTIGFPGRVDWNPGGVSEAWRVALNALDDLLALGVAAALAPDEEVRRRWHEVTATLVRGWITGVPPGSHVAWSVPALARRIPNLLYFQVLFAPELRADTELRRLVLESLYAQADALATLVESQPAGPPLVDAGRALFLAGRFFDGMEARAWLERGAVILWGQLREQVNDDGGHVSRNPATHAQVLADYLEVLAVLGAVNDDPPVWARKRVKGMADFFSRLLHPDGEMALFHGAAIGMTRPAREILATAAVVLHEPGLAGPGPLPGIWPLLVLGERGRRVYASLPRLRAESAPRALRRTGFYVIPGAPGDLMLLDGASPPADGAAAAFGYELSVGGSRLVVAAGAAGGERGALAGYACSTRAHNVVAVAGAEQMANGRPPAVSDVQWVTRDGLLYFTGRHDGFARLASDFRLHHRRHVFCLPGRFWVVCDEVLGTGTWEVESFVHFHPDVVLSGSCAEELSFRATRSEAASGLLVVAGARTARVEQGVEGPLPQGWYAPRAGEHHAAPVLTLVVGGRLPLVFGYALLPRAEQGATLTFDQDAFHVRAALTMGGTRYLMSVIQGDVELVVEPA